MEKSKNVAVYQHCLIFVTNGSIILISPLIQTNSRYLSTNRQNSTNYTFCQSEDDASKIAEHEVYWYLANINTRNSTISEDYPSWVTKNNAHNTL